MRRPSGRRMQWCLLALMPVLAACQVAMPAEPRAGPPKTPLAGVTVPVAATAAGRPSPDRTAPGTPAPSPALRMAWPKASTEVEMGSSLRFIVEVSGVEGWDPADTRVAVTLLDPHGETVAALPTTAYGESSYRTAAWMAPHRAQPGAWGILVEARAGAARVQQTFEFSIKNSTSEVLLGKYGFWLDRPALGGIQPDLYAERGDSRNGMIRWGGAKMAQHVQPEAFMEIQWREGDFDLRTPAAVRRFMLHELGDLGFTPVRELAPAEPFQFQAWDAWLLKAQAQLAYQKMEWVVFFAPEAGKTYAIGTTVVQPPAGVNAHQALRESFRVHPELSAAGVAPEPLVRLEPAPQPVSPTLGAQILGIAEPVVLRWEPARELAQDEYYEIDVDYDYRETTSHLRLTSRHTQVTLPEALYRTPNCTVFNWQVTVKRQTGTGEDGQPVGQPVSYGSLYWYLRWVYPPGQDRPFKLLCPNALR